MNQEEYVQTRLDDQIDWFDRKSALNQSRYKLFRVAEILLAATIPLLSGYAASTGVNVTIGLFGIGIAVIAGILSLYKYQENWLQYRTTCEALQGHKFRFATRVAPYVGEGAFALLVRNVEQLLSEENQTWSEYATADASGEKQG